MRKSTFLFLIMLSFAWYAKAQTIADLDAKSSFHIALMSDNKGHNPSEWGDVAKWDQWARSADFCLGLGDHLEFKNNSGENFHTWLQNDSWWKTHFYPTVADGENQYFSGNQGKWGTGAGIYNFVDNFYNRAGVTFRTPGASPDVKCDYYFKYVKNGFTLHIFQCNFADNYDGSMGGSIGMVDVTKNWLYNQLGNLLNKTDHDIVIVLAHSTGGDWINQGQLSTALKERVCTVADVALSATTHRLQRWDRYTEYNGGKSVISYNVGGCGSGNGTNGYIEMHILDNPVRITIQQINTENNTSRNLQIGGITEPGTMNGSSIGADITKPIVKTINGTWSKIDDAAGWNSVINASAGTNNATYSSQSTIPTSMTTGQTASVSVTMKNTGTTTWTSAGSYKLGSQNVQDNPNWGFNRVAMGTTESIAPNALKAFTFTITAPATPGTYNFQWKMVQDGVAWFGAQSTNVAITVSSPVIAVTGVTVSPTPVSLIVNATQQLTATVLPSNATNKSVNWTSSNTTVATVSSTGLVTAKVAGTATITVTTVNSAKTATSAITVTAPATYFAVCNALTENGTWTTGTGNTISVTTSDVKQGGAALKCIGTASNEFKFVRNPVYNSGLTEATAALKFWYYCSAVTSSSARHVELGSGGVNDVNEYDWNLTTTLAPLINGWYYIDIKVTSATKTGTPVLSSLNWFRFYASKSASLTTKVDAIQVLAATASSKSAPMDENQSDGVTMYPNPISSESMLTINVKGQGPSIIKIYDMNGKIVYLKALDASNSLNIFANEILKKGLYNVSIISQDAVISKQLIVR